MAEVFYFHVQEDRSIKYKLIEPIMQEDKDVATWRFRIPKVLNQIDMSGWSWWFVYVNAKGQEYSEFLTLIDDIDEPSSYSTADYDIDYGISKFPGSFSFALEAISTEQGGEISGEWHTRTYSHKVDKTLQGNQAEYAETESDIISALMQEVRNKVNQLVGGATPLPVNLKSLMTDHDKVYLYTGSETGESTGYWYYYNGTQFVPGGLYGAGIQIDPTLTQSGRAADAKVTGDSVDDLIESTMTATLDISRFKTYSYWSFGSKVNPVNGYTSANEPAYCRTTWVSFTQPVMVLIDDPNYEWCVWGYVSNTSAGGAYTPSARYSDKPIIIRPINGAVYFRIGVRRKDEATLTTDYSDTTSDAYKIINSLRTFVLSSDVLSDGNAPITGKAVMDNALVFKGGVPNGTDLNTVITAGVYYITSGNTYINSPTNAGILFVYKVNTFYAQLLYTFGESDSFIPALYSRFAVGASVTTIATKWRMVGKYRKRQVKMACFGDSIMYGQNGNTSLQVEEQYRIPSMLAYNLNIDTTNYGVGSQGYIGLISEKAYNNIASKDLTQFNAMLMCYGVNDGYSNLGAWDSTDETTIMGQFNKIVAYVFSQNPSIRLIVVAPYNGRNVGSFPKYWYGERSNPDGYVSRQVLSDTLKQACEYYNIPYIEQKNSPINGYTIQTLIGTDGVHPSLEGYFQLGAWLSGEIGKLIG